MCRSLLKQAAPGWNGICKTDSLRIERAQKQKNFLSIRRYRTFSGWGGWKTRGWCYRGHCLKYFKFKAPSRWRWSIWSLCTKLRTVLLASLNSFVICTLGSPPLTRLEPCSYSHQRLDMMNPIFRMCEHHSNNSVRLDIFRGQFSHLTSIQNLLSVASFSQPLL